MIILTLLEASMIGWVLTHKNASKFLKKRVFIAAAVFLSTIPAVSCSELPTSNDNNTICTIPDEDGALDKRMTLKMTRCSTLTGPMKILQLMQSSTVTVLLQSKR